MEYGRVIFIWLFSVITINGISLSEVETIAKIISEIFISLGAIYTMYKGYKGVNVKRFKSSTKGSINSAKD